MLRVLACRQISNLESSVNKQQITRQFSFSAVKMGSQKDKRVAFEVLSKVEVDHVGPRLGRFSVKGRQDLVTPNLWAIGSRGVVPHISPDLISSQTQIGGIHLALEDCKSKHLAFLFLP